MTGSPTPLELPRLDAPGTLNLPWRIGDLRRVGLANLGGLTALVVAWFRADASADIGRQVTWILIAMAAVAVMGAANCSWFLVGRRAVGLRRRGLLRPVAARYQTSGDDPTVVEGILVSAPGMRHYHATGCQLVTGKDMAVSSPEEHQRAGRSPCGMCQP